MNIKIPPRRVPRDRLARSGSTPGGGLFGGSAPAAHTHVEADITDLGSYLSLAGGTLTGTLFLNSGDPRLRFTETDAATDEGRWDFLAQGNQFRIRTLNDAGSAGNFIMTVDRTGIVVDTINLQGTALQHNGVSVFLSSGGTLTGNLTISRARPALVLVETDASADNGRWEIDAQADQLVMKVTNDAVSAAAAWLTVNRTAVVIDSILLGSPLLTLNAGANAITELRLGETTTTRGNTQDSRIVLYGENASVIANATLVNTGSNLQLAHSTGGIQAQSLFEVLAGNALRVRDTTNADSANWAHDGTDFNLTLAGTTDYNIIGLTGALKLTAPLDIRLGGVGAAGGTGMLQLAADENGATDVELARIRINGGTNNPALIIEGNETDHILRLDATGSTGNASLVLATMGNDRAALNNVGLALVNGIAVHGATVSSTQPTVTGSRASNAALASLLTALANYGLIVDSSS